MNLYPAIYHVNNCKIDYDGRAKAKSENENLVIIIKADKTIICHDYNKGVKPKYYNPTNELLISIEDNILDLESISKKNEKLFIRGMILTKIEFKNSETEDRTLTKKIGTETDIVNWVKDNPEKFGLKKEDFVGMEVKTMSGRIDLLFKDVLIEVKKRAGARTYDQISRYLREEKKKKGFVVCLKATETLKNVVKKRKMIKLIEIEEIEERINEIMKENY